VAVHAASLASTSIRKHIVVSAKSNALTGKPVQ
jgi:hypothetical protein